MLIILIYFSDVDNGEAMKKLILSLKDLCGSNFPQALLTIACVGMGANYDLIQQQVGSCSMGVLVGVPMSGKTTVLKAALSLVQETLK